MSDEPEARKPGRPRQPFCPDCIKAGRPNVPKKKPYGYCGPCAARRFKSYRDPGDPANPVDPVIKQLRDQLDEVSAELQRVQLERRAFKDLYEEALTNADGLLRGQLNGARAQARTYQLMAHEAGLDVPHPDDPVQIAPSMRVDGL
jgi:hypothetical protein